MRYFIYLSYKGTNYSGWQIQPNAPTIQETIERALATILRKPCSIVGAGRTDTGVHAHLMVIHLDLDLDFEKAKDLLLRLNRLLPKDIALNSIHKVTDDAHARFSALSRTYHYYAHSSKDAFNNDCSLFLYQNLNFDRMNDAAKILLEYTDFTSFSKLHTDAKTNICHVSEAFWMPDPIRDNGYIFRITADRFLRNMVRAIVGTLILVGRNRLDLSGFRRIIEGKDRCLAGSSADGHALFLEEITYPKDLFL